MLQPTDLWFRSELSLEELGFFVALFPDCTPAFRVETLAGQTIYYSDQGWALCNVSYLNNWNHWSGSGLRFGRVQQIP